MTKLAPNSSANSVRDVVDPFCVLVCDDLHGQLTDAGFEPAAGTSLHTVENFKKAQTRPTEGECLIDGRSASFDEAVTAAAKLLLVAKRPAVVGLTQISCEAQRAAVALADQIGAVIDVSLAEALDSHLRALQTVGLSTCTLGELRQRADLVVFWGADPATTHPHFAQRIGLAEKRVIAIDSRVTATTRAAAEHYRITGGSDFAAVTALRAALRGAPVDAARVLVQTGIAMERWQQLAMQLRSARYLVIVTVPAEESLAVSRRHEALAQFTRELCADTRCALQTLPELPGALAAAHVLAWTTGFGEAVDLSGAAPRSSPGDLNACSLLERGEIDAAIVVHASALDSLPKRLHAHWAKLPHVVLDPVSAILAREKSMTGRASVAFQSAQVGVDCTGTIYRYDDVPVVAHRLRENKLPSAEVVLAAICSAIATNRVAAGGSK